MQHVFYRPYMALFHVFTTGRWVCVSFEYAESFEELTEAL